MLLVNAKIKGQYVIKNVLVKDAQIKKRLFDLGIKKGAKITIERSSFLKACFIVLVSEKRIALSKQILMEIEV